MMKTQVTVCSVPVGSAIEPWVAGSDFHDAYGVEAIHCERKALEHFLIAIAATPAWVDSLMNIRNRVVALFGLKNLGGLGQHREPKAADAYRPGDRVGIFTLLSQSDDEVLVEDDDKHLRVLVSLRRMTTRESEPTKLVLTTVVHIHNVLGRVYMLPVGPMHKLIAPAVLSRINAA